MIGELPVQSISILKPIDNLAESKGGIFMPNKHQKAKFIVNRVDKTIYLKLFHKFGYLKRNVSSLFLRFREIWVQD
ncbi:MAG: hypothetical protein A2W90_11070 [Bacteroidetes bacterium GWF2_42_66]|nr:MAG: hypothetical protein A2W92_10060 [Bacteroidetes bacterium GWA2_42_15]OFY01881.1 MAG: hypothetical protein A2W89_23500 [Bacteroidetes bacterium GWE2_42_39]OFY44823.1 MAG: hypothetical protein A2W90_11070 [Bacteroidetes bacterium GWF2_42_66]HBL75949.1 hypothetical protein [Prolixibacteraceae bacterium]HCR89756.1 hypothetical protein [Prolixibacteraceae bacterium]